MVFIHGQVDREQPLGKIETPCARCGLAGPKDVVRRYVVKHVYFFPLYSDLIACFSRCPGCAAMTRIAEGPGAPIPLPFLHRFGIAFAFSPMFARGSR